MIKPWWLKLNQDILFTSDVKHNNAKTLQEHDFNAICRLTQLGFFPWTQKT